MSDLVADCFFFASESFCVYVQLSVGSSVTIPRGYAWSKTMVIIGEHAKPGEAKPRPWVFHHHPPENRDANPWTFVLIPRWVTVSSSARANELPSGTPLHLLPLCEAFGDDVVYCRFDEGRADSISLAIALSKFHAHRFDFDLPTSISWIFPFMRIMWLCYSIEYKGLSMWVFLHFGQWLGGVIFFLSLKT